MEITSFYAAFKLPTLALWYAEKQAFTVNKRQCSGKVSQNVGRITSKYFLPAAKPTGLVDVNAPSSSSFCQSGQRRSKQPK